MTEIELKPCPFCGAEAEMERIDCCRVIAVCSKCHGQTQVFHTEETAEQYWNRRTEKTNNVVQAASSANLVGQFSLVDQFKVYEWHREQWGLFSKTDEGYQLVWYPPDGMDMSRSHLTELCNALNALWEQREKWDWVGVEDKLPVVDELVLVSLPDSALCLGRRMPKCYNSKTNWNVYPPYGQTWYKSTEVTHWAHLPARPEQEQSRCPHCGGEL